MKILRVKAAKVDCDMIRIRKNKTDRGIIDAVEEISGVDLSVCYQCRKCSSGCPVGGLAESGPSEIIRRLHFRAGEELLDSELIWMCASCETCSTRCPMGVDFAAVMDALRFLALKRFGAKPKGNAALFNRAFLKSIKRFGRIYDLGMVASYKFSARNCMADTEKFPKMLMKRKLALLPSLGGSRKAVKRIFNKTLQNKGDKG